MTHSPAAGLCFFLRMSAPVRWLKVAAICDLNSLLIVSPGHHFLVRRETLRA